MDCKYYTACKFFGLIETQWFNNRKQVMPSSMLVQNTQGHTNHHMTMRIQVEVIQRCHHDKQACDGEMGETEKNDAFTKSGRTGDDVMDQPDASSLFCHLKPW